MANKSTVETAPAQSEASPQLTLTEFCMRLSEREKRVVLIGGFEHSERVAGRVKDTDAAFQGRFQEFINKPA